jgi:hypothetical protein
MGEFVEDNPMPEGGFGCVIVPRNIENLLLPLPTIEEPEDSHSVTLDYQVEDAVVIDYHQLDDAPVADEVEKNETVMETPEQLEDLETGNSIAT